MTHREQALVDQMRQWRAQIDATPEQPWEAPEPNLPSQPREDRLAEARARREGRLHRPLNSPEPSPIDLPPPPTVQRVIRLDDVVTKEDAEFAAWKRKQRAGRSRMGTRRGARYRR